MRKVLVVPTAITNPRLETVPYQDGNVADEPQPTGKESQDDMDLMINLGPGKDLHIFATLAYKKMLV